VNLGGRAADHANQVGRFAERARRAEISAARLCEIEGCGGIRELVAAWQATGLHVLKPRSFD
jgi:hypothetical protein